MAMLSEERATFIFGLFLTALGWHFSQITDEIRSSQAVSYEARPIVELDPATRKRETALVVTIENISKEKAVRHASFSLICTKRGAKLCIKDNSLRIIAVPPTLSPEPISDAEIDPRTEVEIDATIAAGGMVSFKVWCDRTCPMLYFIPDNDKPLDLLMIERRSLRGFFATNYFLIVLGSFIVILVCFIVLAARLFFTNRSEVAEAKPGTRKPRTAKS
jgi:hypothetical protein